MEKYVIIGWTALAVSLVLWLMGVLVGHVVNMWREARKNKKDMGRLKYAVENGYETDADIPSEELARILSQKQKKEKKMDKNRNWENGDVLVDVLTRQPFLFWKMEGGKIYTHCGIDGGGRFCLGREDWSNPKGCRLATLEEKNRLKAEMKKRGLVFLPGSGYMDIIHENVICNTALEHYGVHSQIVKCMEECGELIQALARNLSGESSWENVVEELADVEIMLEQMRAVFGRQKVHRVMTQKLARLKMRMEEEEG